MIQQWLLQQIQPRVQKKKLASAFGQTFTGKLNTLLFFVMPDLSAKAPVGLLAQITRQLLSTVKLKTASTCLLRDRLGY